MPLLDTTILSTNRSNKGGSDRFTHLIWVATIHAFDRDLAAVSQSQCSFWKAELDTLDEVLINWPHGRMRRLIS